MAMDVPDLPLTPEQRTLVLMVLPLARKLARRCPYPLALEYGRDGVEQEAYVGACRAAVKFDRVKRNENLSIADGWAHYAARGIRSHLSNLIRKSTLRHRVWCEWPHGTDGETYQGPHAAPEFGTALQAWCEEGARELRSHLPLRWRVILYLVAVEGWRSKEVADALGMTRQRLSSIRERAVESLWAGARTKRRGKSGAKPEHSFP